MAAAAADGAEGTKTLTEGPIRSQARAHPLTQRPKQQQATPPTPMPSVSLHGGPSA